MNGEKRFGRLDTSAQDKPDSLLILSAENTSSGRKGTWHKKAENEAFPGKRDAWILKSKGSQGKIISPYFEGEGTSQITNLQQKGCAKLAPDGVGDGQS